MAVLTKISTNQFTELTEETKSMRQFRFVLFLFSVFFLRFVPACAQFRVVDADDGSPIACAYILSPQGKVLEMTDAEGRASVHHGRVKVAMLSYQSQTVDADSVSNGEVRLKLVGLPLGEASAGATGCMKISTVFRDVFRNDGRIVLYREGFVDYYYDFATKKMSRKLRGERKYSHPQLFRVGKGKPTLYDDYHFNLAKVTNVENTEQTGGHGDTIVWSSNQFGVSIDSAIVSIRDDRHGIYRDIINKHKMLHPVVLQVDEFFHTIIDKYVVDWVYSDVMQGWSSLVGARVYRKCRLGKNPIVEESTKDILVTGRYMMTAEEAKADAKAKVKVLDFILPANMPDVGISDWDEALKGLVCKVKR